MQTLDYIVLAVANPLKSAELYDRILGTQPVEKAGTFVLYVLPNGLKFGLWARDEMQPAPMSPGGVEISFTLPGKEAVRKTFGEWTALGLRPVQEPVEMDFGFTCVLADPDGHRLRPFAMPEGAATA